MRQLLRLEGLSRICLVWQRLSHTCEEYAKQFGLACTFLFILRLIEDGTTQKELSSASCFPEHTVNKVIWSFAKRVYQAHGSPQCGCFHSILVIQ